MQLDAWRIKRETCPDCGHPREECRNPAHSWYPQRTVCHAAMEQKAADARYDALHEQAPFHDGTFTEWGSKRTPATPYHFRDGVEIWVSRHNLTPDDNFLANNAPTQQEGGD